jgi:[acyl-carrier-protein] S-malonyltransferase
MKNYVLLFPGQGKILQDIRQELVSLPEAIKVLDEAGEILGFDVFEKSIEELGQTRWAQLAIFLHSLALAKEVIAKLGQPRFVAGHSLGLLTAYALAGIFDLEEAVKVVHHRGVFMQAACDVSQGAMAAVIGAKISAIDRVCCDLMDPPTKILGVANYNSSRQIVISGHQALVEKAAKRLERNRGVRVIRLAVSGAFHSPLMIPAKRQFASYLDTVAIEEPSIVVVDGDVIEEAGEARRHLSDHMILPVNWQKTMEYLFKETDLRRFVVAGPGSVLTKLAQENFKLLSQETHLYGSLQAVSVEKPVDLVQLEGFLA